MRAGLRVLAAGPGCSVQDLGRRGLARWGVSPAGPVDWARHALALALAGEAPDAPAIEVGPAGLVVEAAGCVALGLAGPAAGAPLALTLAEGERLEVRPRGGWATLAARGLDPGPPVMGSHATSLRTGIGPPLPAEGALYPCRGAEPARPGPVVDPVGQGGPIRLLPGPQRHLFGEGALEGEWAMTPRRDRMGCWLEGPPVRCEAGHDIASDGVVEGAIQVPGSGAPVVLMAERQTTGGYPKPAVVIRADLPRLAQMAPGTTFRLAWTTRAEARAARLALEAAIRAPEPRARPATAEALAAENLVSGVWAG